MTGLVKKLLICAAVDGLLLQPIGSRSPDNASVCIKYGTTKITSSAGGRQDGELEDALEAHGIVGLLNLVTSSYLIAITRREQVAQIRDRPIFTIRDVTLIPLTSQAEAEKAIGFAQKVLSHGGTRKRDEEEVHHDDPAGEDSDAASVVSDVESIDQSGNRPKQEPEDEAAALEVPQGALKKSAVAVKNTAAGQGGNIGRYAQKWFARGSATEKEGPEEGLTVEQRRQAAEALPSNSKNTLVAQDDQGKGGDMQGEDDKTTTDLKKKGAIESLTPRILRSARLYFSSSGFFFSYEHNLSGTLAASGSLSSDVPLWRRFDTLYFWNRHLLGPFTSAGLDWLALPIMQGFVGQRAFSIAKTEGAENDVVAGAALDAEDVVKVQNDGGAGSEALSADDVQQHTSNFLLTLISRRSVKRAGLRYLRRGVDDDGYVANNVETEQILSSQSWSDAEKAFSLLQVRGSIPLFFSQSPYSFKPLPVTFGSETANQTALKRHFELLVKRYNQVQVASLVDKHGTEVGIGEAYDRHAKALNEAGGADGKNVSFEWFDFHSACKGMKFENVWMLLETLNGALTSFGWLVKQNDTNTRQQTGVLRTNCMDCLDRTNVVQSAVAGWALQKQLFELGLTIDLHTDPQTQWFNTLWADNGDAISKQYAGTSALKGDFTRTRKRNWTGALSDFSLTLNRYYNNVFGDYFLQTCIDYYLGNAEAATFDEFETDMMSQDYALDMRNVRRNAIETCQKIVLEDPAEQWIAGWTLSCPHEAGTLRTLPFEECVLLLTGAALYFCRFDWGTEKVGSFERVGLADVTELWRGAYITSALGPTHLDEKKNVGFALRYKTDGPVLVKRNTRALGNEDEEAGSGSNHKDRSHATKKDEEKDGKRESRLLAFKALPPKAAAAKDSNLDASTSSEIDAIRHICEEIQKASKTVFLSERGYQYLELDKPVEVQEKAIVSAAEARKSTGYVESIGYSLKKLVWS